MPGASPTLASGELGGGSDNTEVKECLADRLIQLALERYVQKVVDAIRDEKRNPGFVRSFDTQEDLDADAVMGSPCLLVL